MASVLGKRARDFDSALDSSCVSSRVKRRALSHAINDENVDPAVSLRQDQDIHHNAFLDQVGILSSIPSKPSEDRFASTKQDQGTSHKIAPERSNTSFTQEDKDVIQLLTPKTPRHRDALSKKVPITPRHRIGTVDKSSTLCTPRTPQTPTNAPTIYNNARQLFTRNSDPGRVIGRDDERRELQAFLDAGLSTRSGQCIYISGPPGTGKSALVSEIALGMGCKEGVGTAHINCMSVRSSGDIYKKLITEFLTDDELMNGDEVMELRSAFISKNKSAGRIYVVTLDEIDHLLTLDLEAIYRLFEWSLHRFSRLIVIGIANALDLTDRFLPRLKTRKLSPQLLPFLPYTAPQIASVITMKLRSLMSRDPEDQSEFVPFVDPAAIQLCSKRVASQTGDLRKAFDIIRRTIDLVEAETRAKRETNAASRLLQSSPSKPPLAENPNFASPSSKRSRPGAQMLEDLTLLTAPRATIAHVSRASAAALSHGTLQRLQTLNLQQRAALCALIYHQKASRRAANSIFSTPSKKSNICPTVKALHGTYANLCKRENALHPLTATEFSDVISGLETFGLVGKDNEHKAFGKISTPSKKGRPEERRILSFVDEKEIQACLDGMGGSILRSLLEDDDK